MLVAFDTATGLMSLALHDGEQIVYEATWRTTNNHTIELSPAIRQALGQTQLSPADLTAVAVAQGPGSFTGLRIGMGVAKGLAFSQQIPLLAVPTLDIVAQGVPAARELLFAVIQAGRSRICARPYAWRGDTWQPTQPAEILTWEALASQIVSLVLIAGEVDQAGRTVLESLGSSVTLAPAAVNLRRAGVLADMAWRRLRAGETDDLATVSPVYLHQPGVPHP